jgi:tripartite-type tricarboxylate transporter receptor subunit TctC
MTMMRRQFLGLAAVAAGTVVVPNLAIGQSYPTRPVRLIVGHSPGGAPDVLARLMAQWLTDRLGQPFIIENRTGGGGNIATEAVVNAIADGHTLLLVSLPNAVNVTLYEKLGHDFIRDIVPIAGISRDPNLMVVNPSFPAKTVQEFITYAKARPGQLTMASAGSGSSPHMAGELFKFMTGIDMVHVPYRGSPPALNDLLGGQVHVYFGPMVASIEHVKAGRLRALAVTAATRLSALPNIPSMSEFVPGYEFSAFYGIGAPKHVAADIVDKLNREINAGLTGPKLQKQLADLGSSGFVVSPSEFGKFIAVETEKWAKVIRAANIRPPE